MAKLFIIVTCDTTLTYPHNPNGPKPDNPTGVADEYPYEAARKCIQRAADLIGAEKIMWGKDVPGLLTSGSYRQLLNYVRLHCDFLSDEEMADVLGLNALRVYWGDAI